MSFGLIVLSGSYCTPAWIRVSLAVRPKTSILFYCHPPVPTQRKGKSSSSMYVTIWLPLLPPAFEAKKKIKKKNPRSTSLIRCRGKLSLPYYSAKSTWEDMINECVCVCMPLHMSICYPTLSVDYICLCELITVIFRLYISMQTHLPLLFLVLFSAGFFCNSFLDAHLFQLGKSKYLAMVYDS